MNQYLLLLCGNSPLATNGGNKNLTRVDDPCFTELLDKLGVVKELLFLLKKQVSGTSGTLPTEHGITEFMLA